MMNKIKETLSQVFFSDDSTKLTFWDESDIECSIDDEEVECEEMNDAPYVGVPAPKYLKHDEWFGPAVISDENKDYMEREYEAFKQDAMNYYGQETKEPDNIHEVMYEMATKNIATTLQLDPMGGSENFQGGSENVHR